MLCVLFRCLPVPGAKAPEYPSNILPTAYCLLPAAYCLLPTASSITDSSSSGVITGARQA
jgi:hypothetical protein